MAQKLKDSKKEEGYKTSIIPYKITEGDSILIKDHTASPFEATIEW